METEIVIGDKWKSHSSGLEIQVKFKANDQVCTYCPNTRLLEIHDVKGFASNRTLVERFGEPVEKEKKKIERSCEIRLEMDYYVVDFPEESVAHFLSHAVNYERFIRFDWSNHGFDHYSLNSILYEDKEGFYQLYYTKGDEIIRPKAVIIWEYEA